MKEEFKVTKDIQEVSDRAESASRVTGVEAQAAMNAARVVLVGRRGARDGAC